MIGGRIGPDVLDLVKRWNSSQVYGHENRYQSEIQSYLDGQLNSHGGGMCTTGKSHYLNPSLFEFVGYRARLKPSLTTVSLQDSPN
jgi:hypothetical protein